MSESKKEDASKIRKWSKDHIIGVSGVMVGALIAIIAPLWDTYFVNTSDLNVEIISISRDISKDSGIILSSSDDLDFLISYTKSSTLARLFDQKDYNYKNKKRFDAKDLRALLKKARDDYKSLSEKIENQTKELEKMTLTKLEEITLSSIPSLNRLLPSSKEVQIDRETFRENSREFSSKTSYFQNIKDRFITSYTDVLDSSKSKYEELQSKIPIAERTVEKIEKDLQENNSFFSISAVLSNSGRASTSVKRQALMRV